MYILELNHSFAAAHQLTHAYSQECNNSLHGHTFKAFIRIQVNRLINGMVIDFKKLKEMIDELDHKNLNEILSFEPTAENLSKYLYDEIEKLFPGNFSSDNSRDALIEITIWESDNASITYKN